MPVFSSKTGAILQVGELRVFNPIASALAKYLMHMRR
jgi:hypothetical protein